MEAAARMDAAAVGMLATLVDLSVRHPCNNPCKIRAKSVMKNEQSKLSRTATISFPNILRTCARALPYFCRKKIVIGTPVKSKFSRSWFSR
jgi:hypothetical protein